MKAGVHCGGEYVAGQWFKTGFLYEVCVLRAVQEDFRMAGTSCLDQLENGQCPCFLEETFVPSGQGSLTPAEAVRVFRKHNWLELEELARRHSFTSF